MINNQNFGLKTYCFPYTDFQFDVAPTNTYTVFIIAAIPLVC